MPLAEVSALAADAVLLFPCQYRTPPEGAGEWSGEWSGGGPGGVVNVAVRAAKRLGHGRQPGSGACHGAVTSRCPVQRLPNRSAWNCGRLQSGRELIIVF